MINSTFRLTIAPSQYATAPGWLGGIQGAIGLVAVAVAGYDLCTGWGTPVGQNLINAFVAGGTVGRWVHLLLALALLHFLLGLLKAGRHLPRARGSWGAPGPRP